MTSRRQFVGGLLGAAVVSRVGAASLPEAPLRDSPRDGAAALPEDRAALQPGRHAERLVASLAHEQRLEGVPPRRRAGARQLAPGMTAHLWGYNGQSPGPTIECVEGDKVRIFVTNKLPEHTTGPLARHPAAERHGRRRRPHAAAHPGRQDLRLRVPDEALRHLHVPPARRRDGADGDGHDGLARRASARPAFNRVDRDFAFVMAAYEIEPGASTPKVAEMLDFNLWTWNSRVFPGIDPLVVRRNDRVRVRIANLTMTNHPIHIHGHNFTVALTDGGWVPKSARWPGDNGRRAGGRDPRDRVRRRQPGRLGVPLPQVAPRDERDGATTCRP